MNAGVLMNEWARCEGSNRPPSLKMDAKKVPFLDVKFKIGDFISDLKVISFFFYSFLLFPYFLRRLVQLKHWDKRKQLIFD